MRRYAIACLALVAVLQTPSLGAPPTGTRIDRGGSGLTSRHQPVVNDSARQGINAYLRCSAALNVSRAVKILDEAYRSEGQLALADDFIPSTSWAVDQKADCFSNFGSVEMRYGTESLIGALAEYFIEVQFDEQDIDEIAMLSSEDWKSDTLLPRNASESLGMCVGEAQARLVYDLAKTVPDSGSEKAIIGQIVPALSPCLPDGMEAQFNATSLRSILVYGLYRILAQSKAARQQL